jgi:hypothetical protein
MKRVRSPAAWKRKYRQLRQSLARVGYISNGSVVDRTQLKVPRTGYQWTRKLGQKTITIALSTEQFEAMKEAIANGRYLRKTIREMEVLSRRILFESLPDTKRYKPLGKRDLMLI